MLIQPVPTACILELAIIDTHNVCASRCYIKTERPIDDDGIEDEEVLSEERELPAATQIPTTEFALVSILGWFFE